MPARRCAMGCHMWPVSSEFGECLICGEQTAVMNDKEPDDTELAYKLLRQAQFEEYYEKYDAEADPRRLDPDLIV